MEMSHEKDEVLKAIAFLDTFSEDKEYRQNLSIIYDYFTDLIKLTEASQKQAKQATSTLFNTLGAINNRQGRRQLNKVSKK